MGLFDGVPAPTYVEPGEDRRRAGLFGLQMAEPFIQAYQKGLDRGESARQFDLGLQEKRRQFDLEGALREAQIARDNAVKASEMAQLDMYKLKAQEVELGLNREKNFQKSANDALAFEQSLNGDYGQEGWQKYLEFAKRDPDIRFTEWGQGIEKRFAVARETQAELNKAKEIAGMRKPGTGRENPDDKRKLDWIADYIKNNTGATEIEAANAYKKIVGASRLADMPNYRGRDKFEAMLSAARGDKNQGNTVLITYSEGVDKGGKPIEVNAEFYVDKTYSELLKVIENERKAVEAAAKAEEQKAVERKAAKSKELNLRREAGEKARKSARETFGGSFFK